MRSFEKMVKEKRLKILLLVLLLVVFNYSQQTEISGPIDLTFLLGKNNDSIEPICVAEGNVTNSAVAWIYPIPELKEQLPQIESHFIPDVGGNSFNCKFSHKQSCDKLWKMDGWNLKNDFDSILDTRWEDFPVALATTVFDEGEKRLVVPSTFRLGISIRTSGAAEIFLCEGWNPHSYPCYYINIGGTNNKEIYVGKYNHIPKNFSLADASLKLYKSDMLLLSADEWKNFILIANENGNFQLNQVYKNVTLLSYVDDKPWKPVYFFKRSMHQNSLWKIHNLEYMFTREAKATQLGPPIAVRSTKLCASMHISVCTKCSMTFYFLEKNKTMAILKEFKSDNTTENLQWKEIKLTHQNLTDDEIKIFVQTKLTDNMTGNMGFWAISDPRICHENEIKISRLSIKNLTMDLIEQEKPRVSCQALQFHNWRPSPEHFSAGENFTVRDINQTATSIHLKLSPTEKQYYLIKYEGKDRCNYINKSNLTYVDKERRKSQGFIITKNNLVIMDNLVPYTYYNITLLDVLNNRQQIKEAFTLPTETPIEEELPKNVRIQAEATIATLQWDSVKCNETNYGPLVYTVNVTNHEIKFVKQLQDSGTSYKIADLEPFTNYELVITTARKYKPAKNSSILKSLYNFTTLPGIAPKLKNVEVYSTDRQSVSIRYELPEPSLGVPKQIKAEYCHPLLYNSCRTDTFEIKLCRQWSNKYCIHISKLMPDYNYTVQVAFKNDNTYKYGEPVNVQAKTIERVPGIPANISHSVSDCDTLSRYCLVQVTWLHPYDQNGTIKAFEVILSDAYASEYIDVNEDIRELLKVTPDTYLPKYSHKMNYIPYGASYNLSVRAFNDKYSSVAPVSVVKIHSTNLKDNEPTFIEARNTSLVFNIPTVRENAHYIVISIVQDYDTEKTVPQDILNLPISKNLCKNFGNTWIASVLEELNFTARNITIGDGKNSSLLSFLNGTFTNKILTPGIEYCITFVIIVKENDGSELTVAFHYGRMVTLPSAVSLPEEKGTAGYFVPLLVLLLMVPIGWLIFKYVLKRNCNLRNRTNNENIYESMPFDEYDNNSAFNETYDKLMHK